MLLDLQLLLFITFFHFVFLSMLQYLYVNLTFNYLATKFIALLLVSFAVLMLVAILNLDGFK